MSVFKRKGSPYYRYDFVFEGRRYQRSTRLTNRIAAQRAEDIFRGKLAERRAGIVEPKPVPVFRDFAPRFLETVKPEIRPNTHRSYSVSVRNLKPWFDPQRLDEITADAIRQFKESRLKEGRAGATVNRDLACLRRILSVAMKMELLQTTPFSAHRVEFLEENGRERILTFAEEKAYLAVAAQPLCDVATVILETGLRPGEVFSLRRSDLHPRVAAPYVHVAAGKTKNAIRDVPLTGRALAVLKRRLAQAKGDYLFPLRVGNGHNPDQPMNEVQPAHEAALEKSKIKPYFRPYDLRHTYGTRAIEAGIDPLSLAKLMGHADLKTTQRYVHLSKRHLVEAQKKIEAFRIEREFADAKAAGQVSELPQ